MKCVWRIQQVIYRLKQICHYSIIVTPWQAESNFYCTWRNYLNFKFLFISNASFVQQEEVLKSLILACARRANYCSQINQETFFSKLEKSQWTHAMFGSIFPRIESILLIGTTDTTKTFPVSPLFQTLYCKTRASASFFEAVQSLLPSFHIPLTTGSIILLRPMKFPICKAQKWAWRLDLSKWVKTFSLFLKLSILISDELKCNLLLLPCLIPNPT